MRVRQAGLNDAAAMHALAANLSGAAHWNLSEYRAIFDPTARKRTAFVVENESEKDEGSPALQGFIVATSDSPDWEIENVVIDPAMRRRGLGSLLVKAGLEAAKNAGAERILLEVRASNQAAIALYQAAGFQENGRRKAYYRNPEEDAFLMCKIFV